MKLCRICQGPVTPPARTLCSAECRLAERRESVKKAMKRTEERTGQTWHAIYADKKRQTSASYYAEHRDRILAGRKGNNDAVNRWAATRRARKIGAEVVPYLREDVIARDLVDGCYLCELPFDPDDVHIDHVTPLSLGGADAPWNVAATHPACNLLKGANGWPTVTFIAPRSTP